MEATEATFGELLKRHRIAIGLSQESLAERAGLSVSAIGALERGERRAPYRETVTQLADALGIAAADRVALANTAKRARDRGPSVEAAPAAATNVPLRLTSLIGRDTESGEIEDLLQRHRLVTVTGPGGIGKTSVAQAVARRRIAGGRAESWFVDLAPVSDGTLVVDAIASVLDIPAIACADRTAFLTAQIKARTFLLILDNCEHVVADAAHIASAILRNCPGVTIIATSRERLAIQGERVYRLGPLAEFASFQLFSERASALASDLTFEGDQLEMSAEICRRLEGIPLALELAASRLPALGLATLNQRLKEHFVVTSDLRDIPQRQRTMIATIAWSYELLSEPERVLLRRLAVFSGGAPYDAILRVCGDDALTHDALADLVSLLVEKSLLMVAAGESPGRYMMLESVRAFALMKLSEAGEHERTWRAYTEYLDLMTERECPTTCGRA